jgi:hypothetical protein
MAKFYLQHNWVYVKSLYSVDVLRDNTTNGHHFILASVRRCCLGFASFQHDYLNDKVTRLHNTCF